MEPNISKSQIRQELRKRWGQEAVELAMMGRWDDAAAANERILEMFPDDIRARNRLGKAYLELGRLQDAAAAYEKNLQKEPSNPIARRKLTELLGRLEREPVDDEESVIEPEDEEFEELDEDLELEEEPEGDSGDE
jgi:tetratricopeptide (TPR) repeat protein